MIETEEIKKHDLLKKIIYTYVHSHSLIIHPNYKPLFATYSWYAIL